MDICRSFYYYMILMQKIRCIMYKNFEKNYLVIKFFDLFNFFFNEGVLLDFEFIY